MPPKKETEKLKNATRRRKAATTPAEVTKSAKKARVSTRRPSIPDIRLPDARLTKKGVVLTCGQGEVGQLGLGQDIMERKRFSVVSSLTDIVDIRAGGMHTICLSADGDVYTFGCDDDGALGRQATDENSFNPEKVKLEEPAIQISAGDSHSAALLPDGRVFAWGSFRDSHGQMGLTTKEAVAKTPTLIKLNEPVIRMASGSDHLLLLTSSGQLFSCGCPEQGQLGRVPARSAKRDSRAGLNSFLLPSPLKFRVNVFFTDIWASCYGTFALEKKGKVYVFGLNNYHQLGLSVEEPVYQPKTSDPLGSTNKQWVKVEGGEHHTLLLDSEGKVYSLGRKEYGRLGLGKDIEDALQPTLVPKLADIKCVDIASGSAVSFAVTENGECYGWGMGTNGQLGAGDDEEDVWEPQLLKGKQLEDKKILRVAAGGQHTVLLAAVKNSS